MSDQRFIIEMGMGNDLHGQDYTKAAKRAVESALHRSSLHILGLPGLDRDTLRVKITIGVQDPGAVDTAAIAALLPLGTPVVEVLHGGLNATQPDTGETIVAASAAVAAFLQTIGIERQISRVPPVALLIDQRRDFDPSLPNFRLSNKPPFASPLPAFEF